MNNQDVRSRKRSQRSLLHLRIAGYSRFWRLAPCIGKVDERTSWLVATRYHEGFNLVRGLAFVSEDNKQAIGQGVSGALKAFGSVFPINERDTRTERAIEALYRSGKGQGGSGNQPGKQGSKPALLPRVPTSGTGQPMDGI